MPGILSYLARTNSPVHNTDIQQASWALLRRHLLRPVLPCPPPLCTTQIYDKPPGRYYGGIFYGGHGQLLLCQFIAVLVTVGWAVSVCVRI